MKVQNCPLCGGDSYVSTFNTVWCLQRGKLTRCIFGELPSAVPLEVWNRIRIAPDNEPVNLCTHPDGLHTPHVYFKDWMQPRYPDEKKEQE